MNRRLQHTKPINPNQPLDHNMYSSYYSGIVF